ncbi:nuclear pore complex protein GP210 [Typha latifolia]|uniref:nuclear pore complex protein GP210 n=1 Tax=Typha latifolia TaxID=4733 RepID=UPI003C2DED93
MVRRPVAAAAAAGLVVLVVAGMAASALSSLSLSGPHIGDLNVLLPPRMTNPVEYRLQGSDGCFSWSWDHHDILYVQPEYNVSSQCSTSARLISIAPYIGRKETSVYATDLHSGTTIRCKVFIDKISRIQIFHHSVKIDLDELATLRIRAFDEEENVFSSLVGLQFLWQLVPKSSETDNIYHLIHVPLKETPLSDCGGFCGDLDTQIKLEEEGIGSDLFVVKGVKIGHEVVSAQLLEPELHHVVDMIILTVAEAMSLDPPSPIFVTVGALINYKLRVIRLNTVQAIDLPSQHHRWQVTNSSVAWVDSTLGTAHTLEVGVTNVVVEDTRVSGHIQTSSLHVVIPKILCLSLVPLANASIHLEGITPIPPSVMWYVFPGQEYLIHVKAFADELEENEIQITENNDLKLESSTSKYWVLSPVSDHVAATQNWRNSRLFKPVSEGEGILTSSLTYWEGNSEVADVLKHVQEINVCSKVKLIVDEENEYSKIVHLPWVPGVCQELELKAIGGCGGTLEDYKWFSSDETIVSISALGFVCARRPGKATITVFSTFDIINSDEVVIDISIPSSMVILPIFPVEAVVGTQLQAAVALKTSNGTYFRRCDAFNSFVRWKVLSENKSFKIVDTSEKVWPSDVFKLSEGFQELFSYPCAWTRLNATNAGRATLAATLSYETQSYFESFEGPTILKAASTISAYYPLMVYQAGKGDQFGGYWVDLSRIHTRIPNFGGPRLYELYLVPGSAMDVLLFGGPEQWDQRVEYVETVDVIGESEKPVTDNVIVQQASSGDVQIYQVSCRTRGKFRLLFSRGNLVGPDHPIPAIANVQLPVVCNFPSSITLIANEPANTLEVIKAATFADRGRGGLRTSPIIVSNGHTIRVASVGIHATGRAFANSSSLCLRWELIGCEGLAYWNETGSTDRFEVGTWERFLVLQNLSGLCTVRATVYGFPGKLANEYFGKESSLFEGVENIVTDALQLQMVSSLRVIPESTLLVLNPEAKVNLSVTGGTCFLDAASNDLQVAEIILHPENMLCSHLIVGARGLGVALVTVYDIGLSPPTSASSLVRVANVDWIKIVSEEEISLMQGTTKDFEILAGTEDGCVFEYSQYMYMNIKVHLEDEIVMLNNGNDSSKSGDYSILKEPSFSIMAANLGITSLYVSARQQSGRKILSQLIKVEVYEPLQVHPAYIYLVPGSSYVLTVKGGPKTGASIEYISMGEDIAVVHMATGKLLANSIGNTTVRAVVHANGGTLICDAYGQIEVGIPSAMSINMQSDQLCVGCSMPIFPSFSEGDIFSFFETCQVYMWLIENEKVLNFQLPRSLQSDVNKALSCEGKQYPCYSDISDNGYVNVLLGRSAGKTRVTVSVSCDFVLAGNPQPVYYNASKSVTVVPDPPLALGLPITWVLPPFYTTSEILPKSFASHQHLDSRKVATTTYSLLTTFCGNNDIQKREAITIDGAKIRTQESGNIACIQAKEQATGRKEIASCVRVTEVVQVRVATAESSIHEVYVAVNDKVELIIKYCDHLGYMFTEAKGVVPMDVETNYPDIVSVSFPKNENNTHITDEFVILQARSPGRALVRISIGHNPRKADFILVTVGAQLYPRNPVVHLGQSLNFTVAGDGMSGLQSGHWLSGNESILSVDRLSGESRAHGEGVTEVIFKSLDLKLQTTVTVLNVDQIIVDAPLETLTNVPFPSEGYKFSVRSRRDPVEAELKLGITASHIRVPYDCRVDPSFLGYAKPWSDHVTMKSYCLFFPYSPRQLQNLMSTSNLKLKNSIGKEGFMYVSVTASLREAPEVMESAHALFIGGFSISIRKLNLTPNTNRSLITVIGNTEIELFWSAKDLLLVQPLRRSGSGLTGYVEYQVEVLKRQPFTDKVCIVLPSTGQTAEVDVSYVVGENATPTRMSGITWPAILVCAIVLISTVLVFLRLLDKPTRTTTSRQGTPAVAVPMTPERTSSGNSQSTPHTPPPLMEYVRRTLDETPYYKRDRRRYNSQYTY